MQTGNVTTPFGRRSISLTLVRRQRAVAQIKAGKSAEKRKVFRDVSAAMVPLGIQSNSLAVLDALLSFYPENDLRQDAPLIVFPSNAQLSLRAHGMAGSTLRRHLAALVDVGLIVRKDSANGKRYVRRDRSCDIENAFGFDLSPLLSRAEEFAMLAQHVMAQRTAFKRMKENLTICRRDVRKLIMAAMEEGAQGDWQAIEDIYVGLIARLPRTPSPADVRTILEEMQMLKEEVLNRLENQEKAKNSGTNDAHVEHHIQNSKPESMNELEPGSRKEQGAKSSEANGVQREPLKALPLGPARKLSTMGRAARSGLGAS